VHVGTAAGPRVPGPFPARWSPVSAADFNGDGHIDVLFFNRFTGRTWIGYLFAGTLTGAFGPTLPSGWQVIGSADFNQDDHPDFLLQSSTLNQTLIWYMNNNIHVDGAFGPRGVSGVVAVADFNGDGYPDYLFVEQGEPGDRNFYTSIWYMHNNVKVSEASG